MNIKETIKNVISNPSTFLLHNLGTKQTIAKNTFWLALAEGITRFLKFFLIIYVARVLGATEYGKFTFALAFVSLFVVFSDFGISAITTREIAREKEKEKEFSTILFLKLVLSIGTLLLIYIGSFFITSSVAIQKIIWILGIYIIINSITGIIYAFLRARQKMEYEALTKVLQAITVTSVGFFVLFNFPSVQNLSFSYLFASLISLIFILFYFHYKIYHLKLKFNKIIWKKVLTTSWPLAFVTISGTIYTNIDSVMMGYYNQIIETGWYNAAYKIIGMTLIPITLISISFFPVLSKFFQESKEKLQNVWNHYIQLMMILAVPLVTGGMVLAPKIIDFVYDPSFFPSVIVFQILIIMTGIIFLSSPFIQVLVASNQQKKLFLATSSGAIINIILNLILIPKYSFFGAAVATVITFSLIFFLLFKFTSKFTAIKPFNLNFFLTFFGALISSIIMYFTIVLLQIYNFNVIFYFFIGVIIYSICFFIYKKLSNQYLSLVDSLDS